MKFSSTILFICVFIFSATLGMILASNPSEGDNSPTDVKNFRSGKVIGIHTLILKEGADPEEFERFVYEELNTISEIFPGGKTTIMNGELGARVDKYIMVNEFNSLYSRNYYFLKKVNIQRLQMLPWKSVVTDVKKSGNDL
jgi:hypothetical protein